MDGKICQNIKFNPSPTPFLHTTKHLEKIKLHMFFILSVNILKKLFELYCSKKIYNLFHAHCTNIEIHKAQFDDGCSDKVCNQFPL